jgi:hypothetical protein
MQVRLPEEFASLCGIAKFKEFEITKENFTWQKYAEIDLRKFKVEALHGLRDLLEPHVKKVRGGTTLLKDIDTWLAVIEHGKYPKPRSVRQFSSIITEMIRKVPGHRVFMKNDNSLSDVWLCFYVGEVEYHPEQKRDDHYYPAYCDMDLFYEEFNGRKKKVKSWRAEECVGIEPMIALANAGVFLEDPERRKAYLKEIGRWKETVPKIGVQFLARGAATDDLDGNPRKRDEDRYGWSHSTNRVLLDRLGDPSRVVIDIFTESDKEERHDKENINTYFWERAGEWNYIEDDDADESPEDLSDDEIKARDKAAGARERKELPKEDRDAEPRVIEVPIHPFCAVFDLRRHLRLRVHITGLEQYQYDTEIAGRIILPKAHRHLVDMLVAHKGVFKDIVGGKGGGITVKLSGAPGTGKTLTVEVYAEAMQRPLYSVQCSQLGTNPNELEGELHKVFTRALRWNAILLLDEADVYVHKRGNDLQQNAIVGVFLRVLEYFGGVLFLTTNRADQVDDAIASRCIAGIDYPIPPPEDQARIWRVLSEVMGLKVPAEVIAQAVKTHPHISGRDVKNLLKLAQLVTAQTGEPITTQVIEFVRQFKPTHDEGEDEEGPAAGA